MSKNRSSKAQEKKKKILEKTFHHHGISLQEIGGNFSYIPIMIYDYRFDVAAVIYDDDDDDERK